MRKLFRRSAIFLSVVLAAAATMTLLPAYAQYPGQIKKEDKNAPVLRSVAVLEYTGDPGQPKTSRLIPITVYDGQQLQDGGIYLALSDDGIKWSKPAKLVNAYSERVLGF